MSTIATAGQLGQRMVRRLSELISAPRRPVTSLSSMTLDADDADLARYWLRHRDFWQSTQPIVEFEQKFAEWNQSRCACAFRSCREALSACIDALELQAGDQVILPELHLRCRP